MALRGRGYKSIKSRFISYIVQIVLVSGVISIIIIGGLLQLIASEIILPANYYEQQIPNVREVIYQEKTTILMASEQGRKVLDTVILGDRMAYQVVDATGRKLYANGLGEKLRLDWIDSSNLLMEQQNLKGFINPYSMKYFPLEEQGIYQGAVIIGYRISNTSHYPILKEIAPYFNILMLFIPLIVVISVLLFYAKQFLKAVQEPLDVLQEGIAKVQEGNLDFNLESKSQDEIGKLCLSFEKMRLALKESLEASWKKEEERKNLMSGLAHDLRTPITVIQGHIELVLDEELSKEQIKESILAIQKNTERLSRLVKALNEINKWQQTGVLEMKQTVNLESFMNEKLKDYRMLAKDKEIEISYSQEGTDREVNLYIDRLSQVLDNLMSNSLRFTPLRGKIEVKVKLEGNRLEICVEDSGCGFTKEDLSQALILFYQGDKSRNSGQHYGIGLYIVDELVKKMNGSIQLYTSKLGGAGIHIIMLDD